MFLLLFHFLRNLSYIYFQIFFLWPGVITGLRQEILDARLSLERCKQDHKDELEENQKSLLELQQSVKEALEETENLREEIEKQGNVIASKDELLSAAE